MNILAACMALAILGSILAFVCSAEVRGFLFRQIVSFGDGFISFNAKELPDDLQPEAYRLEVGIDFAHKLIGMVQLLARPSGYYCREPRHWIG